MNITKRNARSPRAFISHASEDKDRFVTEFATRLRSSGVDAWFDKWEIGPGDSLVRRIFEEGIESADAFIVVLSHSSVSKPWVREELDAAVVRRVNDGSRSLIPVVLDEGVTVPASLQHLLWVSVPDDGPEGVTRRIVDVLFGRTAKPPLGAPPHYLSKQPKWTSSPADELIFTLIVDEFRAHNLPGFSTYTNSVQEKAQAQGIDPEAFAESVHALVEAGLVDAQIMAGGARWMLRPLPHRVWLQVQEDSGVDVAALQHRLLAHVVNDKPQILDAETVGLDWYTFQALIKNLEAAGLLRAERTLQNAIRVTYISPLAKRALDR